MGCHFQDDHQDVIELKTQASKPAHAEALVPRYSRQTCQGCSAVQQAVVELKQQLGPLPRSLSVRGSTYADSVPSTQDHSGDTNDDRSASYPRARVPHAMCVCAVKLHHTLWCLSLFVACNICSLLLTWCGCCMVPVLYTDVVGCSKWSVQGDSCMQGGGTAAL